MSSEDAKRLDLGSEGVQQMELSEVLGCRTLPREVARRLEAGAGGNSGRVSVEALIGMVVDEQQAADDRKLTRSIIIQLCVALAALLAAFAGSIYMVVKLDRAIANDNGVLVSKASGQPLAVGSVSQVSNLTSLHKINNLRDLSKLKSLAVGPKGAQESTLFTVASAAVNPGQNGLITTTSGEHFEFDDSGVRLVNTTSDTAFRRRRLLQDSGSDLVGAIFGLAVEFLTNTEQPIDEFGKDSMVDRCQGEKMNRLQCQSDADCSCIDEKGFTRNDLKCAKAYVEDLNGICEFPNGDSDTPRTRVQRPLPTQPPPDCVNSFPVLCENDCTCNGKFPGFKCASPGDASYRPMFRDACVPSDGYNIDFSELPPTLYGLCESADEMARDPANTKCKKHIHCPNEFPLCPFDDQPYEEGCIECNMFY